MSSGSAGILPDATQRDSPNQDARPEGTVVDLLVIHNISLPPGEFGGPWIDDLFLNRLDPDAHPYFAKVAIYLVSSHLLIRRDGELLQYVPLHRRAWHAGTSSFNGRACCNDYSIGIELEGDDHSSFTEHQYSTLARTTKQIISLFPTITPERITGHCDIAPGRKTDPGPRFDWDHYRQLLTTLS